MLHAARGQPEMGFVVDFVFPMNPSLQSTLLSVVFYSTPSSPAWFRNRPR